MEISVGSKVRVLSEANGEDGTVIDIVDGAVGTEYIVRVEGKEDEECWSTFTYKLRCCLDDLKLMDEDYFEDLELSRFEDEARAEALDWKAEYGGDNQGDYGDCSEYPECEEEGI